MEDEEEVPAGSAPAEEAPDIYSPMEEEDDFEDILDGLEGVEGPAILWITEPGVHFTTGVGLVFVLCQFQP